MSKMEIFYNTSLPVGDDIESGRPCSIVHFDPKSGEVTHEEHHNMKNVKVPKHALESLARAFLPAIREFYETEEGKQLREQIAREKTKKAHKEK